MIKNAFKGGKARNITSIHRESVMLTAYPVYNRHGKQRGVFHGVIANSDRPDTVSYYYGDYTAGELSVVYFDIVGEEFFVELHAANGDMNRVLSGLADELERVKNNY